MKNQFKIKNNYLFLLVFLIVISIIIYNFLNQNNSNENINSLTTRNEAIKDNENKSLNTNSIKKDNNKILNQQTSQPQEYRVVAEEILYPDEVDFGNAKDEITQAVGKPIKIDILPFSKAKKGDKITLEFDGKVFNSTVTEVETHDHDVKPEPGDEFEGTVHQYFVSSIVDTDVDEVIHNNIEIQVVFDKNGVIDGEIRVDSGVEEYSIYVYKGVAYYAQRMDIDHEIARRGWKTD